MTNRIREIMELQARKRVHANPRLRKHERVIFDDWPNWDQHLRWIKNGTVAEIIAWAEAIEQGEREQMEAREPA